MGVLSNLEPKEVFCYFEEICNIPHPSYEEKKISDYCMQFAKKHGLEAYQDSSHNVVIIKEASEGYEEKETIVLQGHMDMVCQKTPETEIDFSNDGLELEVCGDYIQAKGTTLGGDDGIAVAYCLAILASDSIKHPKLEVILTTGEEVGLLGATAIDVSMCQGRKMINLDSEDEGVFLSGCAGGATVSVVLPVTKKETEGEVLTVKVTGLLGGHSGAEIHKGRANANVVLGTTLGKVNKECGIKLISFCGGDKDNVIPRKATAEILVKAEEKAEIISKLKQYEAEVKAQYQKTDAGLCIEVTEEGTNTCMAVEGKELEALFSYFVKMPNGVQAMSQDMEGLVETSLNLGTTDLKEDGMYMSHSVRSSVDEKKEKLLAQMKETAADLGAKVSVSGEYPGWKYEAVSPLREEMVEVFEKMYGRKPVVEAIHAGVECGLFSKKMPGLDCVSIGPDMDAIHTTEERLSISSAKRVWEFILEVLKK